MEIIQATQQPTIQSTTHGAISLRMPLFYRSPRSSIATQAVADLRRFPDKSLRLCRAVLIVLGTTASVYVKASLANTANARDDVDPSRWDAGITAASLAYDYNAWHNQQLHMRQTSQYLGLRAGLNLGDWRVRYRASLNRPHRARWQYRSSALYAERALPHLRSSVSLGESSTRSPVFDSLNFLGLKVQSEERMRPESRSGFAPVISGIAQSNAKVSIHQAGVPIFETTVPPGPFVIDDLYPNGGGGDLVVTITEADGSTRRFQVSYASLPELLRPGLTRYSVSLGRYRHPDLHHYPWLGMASISYGINNMVTAYGGVLTAQGYHAFSTGIGLNLPVGALTLSATLARIHGFAQGLGLRLAYAKVLSPTRTDIGVAMLHYASRGYMDAAQAFYWQATVRQGVAHKQLSQPHNQLSINVHQPLSATWGAISLSAKLQARWQSRGYDVQYSVAYSKSLGSMDLSLNALRSRNTLSGAWENQYLLSLALPLGSDTAYPAKMNTTLTQRPGEQGAQSSVSGTLGDRNQHSYNVYFAAQRGSARSSSAGASAQTITPYARLGASLATSAGANRQLGVSLAGGTVLFQDGLVFAPALGETIAIVQAQHAQGARIVQGNRLNAQGQAIVPDLQAYRENEVTLERQGNAMDAELHNSSQKVVPTHGAVVLLRYPSSYSDAVVCHGQD